ncbi:MAG TPA: hypothetical protein VIJ92_16300 [Ginsengibacter sp.]
MAISATDKELIKYFTQLNEPQKQSLLQVIKTFFKSENGPSDQITIANYNKELDDAMDRISNGNFTTLQELEKEMHSW